jgi:arginase family enzyme
LPCEPTVGLGTVAGHLAADPEAVVVWVDAHADINTITRNTTTPFLQKCYCSALLPPIRITYSSML